MSGLWLWLAFAACCAGAGFLLGYGCAVYRETVRAAESRALERAIEARGRVRFIESDHDGENPA